MGSLLTSTVSDFIEKGMEKIPPRLGHALYNWNMLRSYPVASIPPPAAIAPIIQSLQTKGYYVVENHRSKEWCDRCIGAFNTARQEHPEHLIEDSDMRIYGMEYLSKEVMDFNDDPLLKEVNRHYHNGYQFTVLANYIEFKPNEVFGSGGEFHRDGFVNEIKALLYLNDVNENNGAFQLLEGSNSIHGILNDIKQFSLKYKQNRMRLDLDELIAQKCPERLKTFTGKAGTMIIFDIASIHRGKPLKSRYRYALTHYYAHRISFKRKSGIPNLVKKFNAYNEAAIVRKLQDSVANGI